MNQNIRAIVPLLSDLDRSIIGELTVDYGRGPAHMNAVLPISVNNARNRLKRLLKHGICEYGPLVSEDDGALAGRGYWLSPFGVAVREAMNQPIEARGELADMVETIRHHSATGVPITATSIWPTPAVFVGETQLTLFGTGAVDGDSIIDGKITTRQRDNMAAALAYRDGGRETTRGPSWSATGAGFSRPIGLSGFAGTGKTEASNFIESEFGYVRQHIAEPLRRMLASLLRDCNPNYTDEDIQRWLVGEWKDGVIVPELGVTSRHLQITLGTEWGREQVREDIWARLWRSEAEAAQVRDGRTRMNDSVRFPNEERPIRAMGGVTILITRPGTGPAAFKWKRVGPLLYRWFGCMWGVHDSERVDRLRPDHVIVNDGSIADLQRKVAEVLARP